LFVWRSLLRWFGALGSAASGVRINPRVSQLGSPRLNGVSRRTYIAVHGSGFPYANEETAHLLFLISHCRTSRR